MDLIMHVCHITYYSVSDRAPCGSQISEVLISFHSGLPPSFLSATGFYNNRPPHLSCEHCHLIPIKKAKGSSLHTHLSCWDYNRQPNQSPDDGIRRN